VLPEHYTRRLNDLVPMSRRPLLPFPQTRIHLSGIIHPHTAPRAHAASLPLFIHLFSSQSLYSSPAPPLRTRRPVIKSAPNKKPLKIMAPPAPKVPPVHHSNAPALSPLCCAVYCELHFFIFHLNY
jgi:hypothetical protein